TDAVAEARGDAPRTQDVLHWQAHAEIGGERERTHELGQLDSGIAVRGVDRQRCSGHVCAFRRACLWGEPRTTSRGALRTVEVMSTEREGAMSATQDPQTVARWSVGGVFLESLANRNFERLAETLAPEVRFRAMLPPGPMDWEG